MNGKKIGEAWCRLFVLLLLMLSMQSVPAQKMYDAWWKSYEQALAKDQPRTALHQVEQIYGKALSQRNFPQLVKAGFTRMSLREKISPDSLSVDIKAMEALLPALKSPVEVALMHALLGDAYASSGLSWRDAVRIKEYRRLKDAHLWAALADREALMQASTTDFGPLVFPGKDSRLYRHDWMSVLMGFVADRLEDTAENASRLAQIWAELPDRYLFLQCPDAALLARLAALDYCCHHAYLFAPDQRITDQRALLQLRQWMPAARGLETEPDLYLSMLQLNKLTPVEQLALAEEALRKFPKSEFRPDFLHYRDLVKAPVLDLSGQYCWTAGQENGLQIRHVNNQDIVVSLCRPSDKKPLVSHTFSLSPTPDYRQRTDTLRFPPVAPGVYELCVSDRAVTDSCEIRVTTLLHSYLFMPDGQIRVRVVDRWNGRPLPGVTVAFAELSERHRHRELTRYVTDQSGCVVAPVPARTFAVQARRGGADETSYMDVYQHVSHPSVSSARVEQMKLFTDRSIYRPGQMVQVTGWVYEQSGDSVRVVPDKEVTLMLRDARGKQVAEQKCVTGAMGSVYASFPLPASGLTGSFSLRMGNASCTLRVEEYSRPSYEVHFLPFTERYQWGDSITLQGCASTYSGIPVQQAEVRYRVELQSMPWGRFWGWGNTGSDELLAEGSCTTDGEGRFSVPVHFDSSRRPADAHRVTLFRVTATVTDGAGESHEVVLQLPLADQPYQLLADADPLPSDAKDGLVIDRSRPWTLRVRALNSLGQEVEAEGTYVCRRKGQIQPVAQGRFVANRRFSLPQTSSWAAGEYEAEFRSLAQGDTMTTRFSWIQYDRQGGRIPVTRAFLYTPDAHWSSQTPAEIFFAVPQAGTHVLVEAFTPERRVLMREWVSADSLGHVVLPHRPEYGRSLWFHLEYVWQGARRELTQSFEWKEPDKALQLAWTSFRNKLLPGQQEEWTLSVRDAKGRPAHAELLATLYDASLDAYVPHRWHFALSFPRPSAVCATGAFWNRTIGCWLNYPSPVYSLFARRYDALWTMAGHTECAVPMPIRGGRKLMRSKAMAPQVFETVAMAAPNGPVMASYGVDEAMTVAADRISDPDHPADGNADMALSALRSDFGETAFFYPQVMTDGKGVATLRFTLPQSLTEWRFMGLAHTADMSYGQLTDRITASKDFMVQPHLPRFVREGDDATFSARIQNRTNRTLQGTACLELVDPDTEKICFTQSVPFTADAEATADVSFRYAVPADCSLFICRLTAQSGSFSDGEQSYLPVLTARRWITESVTFTLRKPGTSHISLHALFNGHSATATRRTLTVEATARPEWMLLQSLSTLSDPQEESAFGWSSAYYVNRMAGRLAQSMAGFRQVVERWRQTDARQHTLSSYLEKNQSLKELVLEESPWLSEALAEKDRLHRLVNLFDANQLNQRTARALEKLRTLQAADGSWSWYPGMKGSYTVTETVVQQLVSLQQEQALEAEGERMLAQAFHYLDQCMVDTYSRMKKNRDSFRPSERELHYLYLATLADHPRTSTLGTACRMWVDSLACMSRELSIRDKAHAVVILQANGHSAEAREFLESLRQYTVCTPEMGRYYDTPKATYSWRDYRIPTQVAAMKAMQTLASAHADTDDYLDDMSVWLIRQKQTQMWGNALTTVDVIATWLSLQDKQTLTAPVEPLQLSLDGQRLQGEQPVAALGYVNYTLPKIDSARELTVVKTQSGLSFGAVYGQCLEEVGRLKAWHQGLEVRRELLVEARTASGYEWRPAAAGETLTVGQKVRIRYTLHADRDMDFVQLRAPKAACMEPQQLLSGYRWQNGQGYYLALKDAAGEYYFDRFRKGTCVIEETMLVTRPGVYQMGIATVQCAYAPQFGGHTESNKVAVR